MVQPRLLLYIQRTQPQLSYLAKSRIHMMGDVVSFTAAVTSVAGLAEAVKAATDAADDVDRKSRFPSEAIDLVREAKLLSCSLPTALGGRSCSITELALIARAL